VSRYLSIGLMAALGVLFVEVLYEAWVQELLGNRSVDADGLVVGDVPGWPKLVKNGLFVALVLLSVAKLTLERRWGELRTRADLAIVVLALVMTLAGLLGTSGPVLIAQALFVYLRGAIVFYAVRALKPAWPQVRRLLWVVGIALVPTVAVAFVQMIVGVKAYSGVGWVDLEYAKINRAHGLLDHPNHLGHVLGLVLIGLVAFMSGRPRVTRWWWVALAVAALGLAATQSRESVAAVLVAALVIWLLRRSAGRTVVIASAVIAALFVGHLLVRPGNLDELSRRVKGVFGAVDTPSGTEDCQGYETNRECVEAGKVQEREVRLLFFQQGARLLAHRPVLGYGVGQFGGIVAEQNDPNWEKDPRFPGGFDLHDFDGTTVDSFWLHLVVEVGILGLLAYLAWLWFLTVPLLAVTRRFAGRRVWGAGGPRAPTDERGQAMALWGVGAMLFTVIVAALAPTLEDPLFPPLLFAVIGAGWVLSRPDRSAADQ
jgi:hypothetical protein